MGWEKHDIQRFLLLMSEMQEEVRKIREELNGLTKHEINQGQQREVPDNRDT